MKKIVGICIMLLLLTGCGKKGEREILRNLNKKIGSLNSYYIEGKMQIINNEDIYKYDVKVSYKDKDLYKVSLKNESNNHEQIILRNDEGVYVLTPSLNKSFKFESEWPYTNSQIYLLQSLLKDINNDKTLSFEKRNDGYIFTSSVNYPNNRSLVKQRIYVDKNLDIQKVEVLNESGTIEIVMEFKSIDKKPRFNDDYFSLKKNIDVKDNNGEEPTSKTIETVFPMFLPNNTALTAQDVISKDDGERVILTFSGDKSFILVEETANISEDLEIIPTIGEPTILMDTIGSLSDGSISWISKGIEYYIASDNMSKEELLSVAKSISVIPVMK